MLLAAVGAMCYGQEDSAVYDSIARHYAEVRYDFSEAIEWSKKQLSIYESEGNKAGQGQVRFELAKLYLSKGRYDKALSELLDARKIFAESGEHEALLESDNFFGCSIFSVQGSE